VFEIIAPPIPPSARSQIKLAQSDKIYHVWFKFSDTRVVLSSSEIGVIIWELTEDFITLTLTKTDIATIGALLEGLRTLSIIASAPLSKFFRPQYHVLTLPPNEAINHEMDCRGSLQFEYRNFREPFAVWFSLSTYIPRVRCVADATPSYGVLHTTGVQTFTFVNSSSKTQRLLLFTRIGKHPDTCLQLQLACNDDLVSLFFIPLKDPCQIQWNLEGLLSTEIQIELRDQSSFELQLLSPTSEETPRASSLRSTIGSIGRSEFSRSGSLHFLSPQNPARAKVSKKLITGALQSAASTGNLEDTSLHQDSNPRDLVIETRGKIHSPPSGPVTKKRLSLNSEDVRTDEDETVIIHSFDRKKFGTAFASQAGVYTVQILVHPTSLLQSQEKEYIGLSLNLSTRFMDT
jgi:hypothetical protein